MVKVDLNCDLGESFGIYQIGNDEEILKYVTSASIACGFHAGDPTTMRKTVSLALKNDVSIGAHPGLPDLTGFGRRRMDISAQEVYDIVIYQIGALNAFVRAEGSKLAHVKPHGALYNMAAIDETLATAIAEAIYKVDPTLILYGLSGSKLIKAGNEIGLQVANEVFADRTYQLDGTLTPRSLPNCFVDSEEKAINQVVKMIKEKKVMTEQSLEIPIEANTVCIHGDGKYALNFAKKISEQLPQHKIVVEALQLTQKKI